MDLFNKKCVPCEVGASPLRAEEIQKYLSHLAPGWEIVEGKRIKKEWKFKNFKEAMAFVNNIAAIAEAEGHHPDIFVFYNIVRLELWTHAVGGLSENDFILATKIESTIPDS